MVGTGLRTNADSGAAVPAGQKVKDADTKSNDHKPKGGADATVRNVFGPEYAAGVVQVNAVGVTKELWLTIGRQWLQACRGQAAVGAAFTYYCFAGACFGGCGKKKEECEAEWKALHPKITVRHGAIPTPLFKLVQTSVNPNWALVWASLVEVDFFSITSASKQATFGVLSLVSCRSIFSRSSPKPRRTAAVAAQL